MPAARRVTCALAGAASFAVAFVLFYRLILYHFYVRGSFLLDSGLLAALTWHSDGRLSLPESLGGESFFAFHVAPILLVFSALSQVLPLTLVQMFAAVVGLSHGLLALAMFWLLAGGYGMQRGWAIALACVAAVSFAASGLAIAIARYPHFETFGAACLLLTFVALALRRRGTAIAAFAFALATREDVGLHAFAFLSLWAIAERMRGVAWRANAWVIAFALAGLFYSAAALLAQHLAYPGHSSFVRVYLGDPPYAHLTGTLIATRLGGWVLLHAAIVLPAIAVAAWALRAREPGLLVGYAACLPWTLLHLLAVGPLAGLMVGYYAYPFLIAMAWPLLAGLLHRQAARARWTPAAAVLALVAISLLPFGRDYDPGHIALPAAFLDAPSAGQQAATDRAVATLAGARDRLGPLRVDNSVAALAPASFARDEIAGWAERSPHSALFLANGFDADSLRALPGLPGRYAVTGTMVRIATDRPAALLALGLPLEPVQ